MSRLPRKRLLLLAAIGALSASAPVASAATFVQEDWHGSSGLNWQQGSATDFLGWSTDSSDGTYDFAKTDSAGRRSLAVEAQFLPKQAPGTGEWRFRAPGTSTITKAEYGPASFTKEGCLNEGMRLANGTWQPTRNAREGAANAISVHPTACGANATVTGAPVTTKDGSTAVTITGAPARQTFCSTANCGLTGSPTGNQAVFGAERIKQGRPGFGVVLPGARLTLTDYDAPKLTGATNSHPRWVRSARGEVKVTSTDTGLGVKSATVTHAGLPAAVTGAQTHPCSGDRTDRCPATWNDARPEWTTAWPYDTDAMPEGVQPYGVAVRDIVENRTPANGFDSALVPPSKIDRSVPTDITGYGQVADLDGQWFLGDGPRTITASAHDTYSGVKTLQIETTGGDVLDAHTFDCSGDQCPRDVSETLSVDTTKLPEGDTTVRLRVTDLVGNTSVGRTWTLRIDRTDPSSLDGGGLIPSLDGRIVNGNTNLTIDASASDQYSGVSRIELLDGDEVLAMVDGCAVDCPHDRSEALQVNSSELNEGSHTLRLRAIDRVDHAIESSAWTIRVDRTGPDFPTPATDDDGGLAPSPYGDAAQAEWKRATDPVLADGSAPAGTASYRVRWRAAGGAWSDSSATTEPLLRVETEATTLELELTAVDDVGNAGPTVTATVKPYEQDDAPIPTSLPSTDPVLGSPDDVDDDDSGGDLNEEYGVAARGPTHHPSTRHYSCKPDTYGPIQAWPSGFVFGVCEPGVEVQAFDLAQWPTSGKPPGAESEGYEWAGVAFPDKESSFNGCGWMSTKKRLDRGTNTDSDRCAKVSYNFGNFVRRASEKRPEGVPKPKSKYPEYLIWATTKVDKDGKPIIKDGKPVQENGMKWTSRGDCPAYSNINPWLPGQTARGAIKDEDGSPWMVNKGDTVKIRYMSKWRAINPETGNNVYWIMAYTGTGVPGDVTRADWAWYSATCLT